MRLPLLLLCAALSAGLTGPADARPRDRQDAQQERQEARQERRERRQDNAERASLAARRAQQRNGGGRVLSVEPEDGAYRVKVLKDGEVRTHRVTVDED